MPLRRRRRNAVHHVIDNIDPAECSNSPPDAAQRPVAGIRDDIAPDNAAETHDLYADKSVLRQPVVLNQMAGAWRAAPAWRAPGNQYPYVEALDRAVPHGDVGVPQANTLVLSVPGPAGRLLRLNPLQSIVRLLVSISIARMPVALVTTSCRKHQVPGVEMTIGTASI